MINDARKISASDLELASRALISARETNLGIEIQMPVVYPSGQCVSVVVSVAAGNYIVHDAGFGTMYLTSAGVDLTKTLSKRLSRLAADYGCEFIHGRMSRSCTEDQLSLAIALVANASRAIGDQVFDHREKSLRNFNREVSLALASNLSVDRLGRKEIVGNSGTTYKISHVVLSQDRTKDLAFVEPIPDRETVNRKLREFFDIKSTGEFDEVERISVYDDKTTWRDGDLAVLSRVSNVVAFSNFSRRLQGMAA